MSKALESYGPLLRATDEVTVGDLKSDKLGTGARKSAGKPDWSQFPFWVVYDLRKSWGEFQDHQDFDSDWNWDVVLDLLAKWQRGDDDALARATCVALLLVSQTKDEYKGAPGLGLPYRALIEVVRVLEFGAIKYAKGNWAKGMPWTVCFNSAMSHLTKILVGQTHDEESKLLHSAHLLCNLVFLLGYRSRFPEGDDRTPEFAYRDGRFDQQEEILDADVIPF